MCNVIRLGNYYNEKSGTGFAGNVWDIKGVCPSLTTMQGGGRTPSILIKQIISENCLKVGDIT